MHTLECSAGCRQAVVTGAVEAPWQHAAVAKDEAPLTRVEVLLHLLIRKKLAAAVEDAAYGAPWATPYLVLDHCLWRAQVTAAVHTTDVEAVVYVL